MTAAAALRLKDGQLSLGSFDVPVLEADEQNCVIIKVAYAGICGTDLHIIAGEFPCSACPAELEQGLVLGHELSGHIVSHGSLVDVDSLPVGSACTVNPNGQCGACKNCGIGRPHFCCEMKVPGRGSVGVYRNGGWASFVKVPAYQVHLLPSNLGVREAVLAEPFSCVLRGYRQLTDSLLATSRILVLGGGIVGILWSTLLTHRGFRLITISEPSEARRDIIEKLDLPGVQTVDPLALPAPRDDGGAFDIIIDCSGFPPAISAAIPLLEAGGKILLFGCCPKGRKMTVEPFEIFDRELTIIGAKVNPFTFPEAVQLVADISDKLAFSRLGIEEFSLQNYEVAVGRLKDRIISKGVFAFGDFEG